jgi:hypothetical protein
VDRIRRQRQKLVGFLLVAVEKAGVTGASPGLGDFEQPAQDFIGVRDPVTGEPCRRRRRPM